MSPLVHALARENHLRQVVCVTGQHREMLDSVLADFSITADENLAVMQAGQSLNALTGRILDGLDHTFAQYSPDMVLVHGDTTTCFTAALAAFHRGIPVGHVEAGLRTGDMHAPWPEEANRRLAGVLADIHFAPTGHARDNLLRENVPESRIHVTGNTVIDALLWMRHRLRMTGWQPDSDSGLGRLRDDSRIVLITGHRRENFGSGLESICRALKRLALRYPQADFVYPVHMNPRVSEAVYRLLGDIPNLYLTDPLDYRHFVWAMERCYLILTDSGGIQEEAPSLGKPVLVMRDNTERPEAQASDALRLVGTDEESIFSNACELMDNTTVYEKMSQADNPFGDGHASQRIVTHIQDWLKQKGRPSCLMN